MDISKLPKLSQTPAPPQGQATNDAPTQATMDYRAPSTPVATILSGWGPEAWISIGLGLILLLVYPHFVQWAAYAIFHTHQPSFLPITDSNNQEVPYPKSIFFLSDLCVSVFAFALMFEGVVLLFARGARAVLLAFVVTCAAVALNLFYVVDSFATDQGFALVSGVAVLVGGYMAMYQWRLIQSFKQLRAASLPSAK